MTLNFIDTHNNKNAKIEIKDIKLAPNNLRYTTLNSLKKEAMDMIKDLGKKSQEEVQKELLSNEGDFSDLVNLLNSILEGGFHSEFESLILTTNSNKNYIVVEGNRRLMCLKLISGDLTWFKNIEEMEDINNLDDLNLEDNEKNDNYSDRRLNNYNKIKDKIQQIKKQYQDQEMNIHFQIIDDNEKLLRAIYTKHVAGDRPGMRKWPRGKYFTDILSCFKEGIESESNITNEIRQKMQREPRTIIEDFKHAQFVKSILKEAEIYNVKYSKITDDMIFDKMRKIKVSPLQSNFGLKRVKDSAKEHLNIKNEDFKEYFDYNYDEKNLLKFSKPTKNKIREILALIYYYYKKGVITTRPIQLEDKEKFNLSVKKILKDINTKKIQTKDVYEKIYPLEYTIEQLNEMIDTIKEASKAEVYENIIARYISAIKVKTNDKQLFLIGKKIENYNSDNDYPSSVFKRLLYQYEHNQKKYYFLNATAATLRSILEQVFVWGFGNNLLKNIKGLKSTNIDEIKEEYVKKMLNNKIHKLFKNIINNKIHKLFKDIKGSVQKDIKNSYYEETKIIESLTNSLERKKIKSILKFIFSNDIEVLNEFIHASHKIYYKNVYDYNIKKFLEWQEVIIEICKNINLDKIKELNEKLIKQLEKNKCN